MKRDILEYAWPVDQAAEALETLARVCGLPVRAADGPSPFGNSGRRDDFDAQSKWLESIAAGSGLEVEAVQTTYAEIDRLIADSAPSLLRLERDGRVSILAIASGGRRRTRVIAPDSTSLRLPTASIRAALCGAVEAPLEKETDTLLDEAQVSPRRRPQVRAALMREQLAATLVAGCWLVRLPPGASMRAQGSLAGIGKRLAALAAVHTVAYALWIVSWWILGRAALDGRLDRGWLLGWALLLITIVPFELLATWLQGRISIDAGALLKRRLLYGALRLEPEEIRHEGAGQLLGRVIESQAIEALTLTGGFLALAAALELIMAMAVLSTVSTPLTVLLLLVLGACAVISWRFFLRRRTWTASRLEMTHSLVEQMVGHRTRTAQQRPESWHEEEDGTLEQYVNESKGMDRATVWLQAAAPRGWLLLAILALSPAFVSGDASTPTLAVAIGGILLAFRAFRRLATGMSHLAGAAIAWTQAAPIFHAAARPLVIGSPAFAQGTPAASKASPLLDGHDLSFRYSRRNERVLNDCSLRIHRGDRLLLEGPSGGGKSTLASLLTGLRQPDSGLLLLDGIDRRTLGEAGWRRRVVAVPQFHENHIFMGTLAFNLLMGAEWPPRGEDLDRAEALCRELGLDALLNRMPAGLLQQVGETGWQLSHGERSRVCIARALLQGGDFVVFDESFGQLDPESLRGTLRSVLARTPTVMVIAHP
jgi:ATP-binding cassette subfamily B protein